MYQKQEIQLMTKIKDHELTPQIGSETRQLLTLGHERGWEFNILGQAPLPSKHILLGDWMIVPAHQDNSMIPARAFERVQSVYAAGLRPKGFVVVHEAPKQLPASQEVDTNPGPRVSGFPNLTPTIKIVGGAIGTLAVATLGIGGLVVAVVAGAVLALPAVLLAGVVALDPILIAVTEDDVWIEIDRWIAS